MIKSGRLEEFNKQFYDTVERGVFRKLTEEEMRKYNGPLNYITMVEAFKNRPHSTTPLRICMTSSMKQPPPSGKSLNDCLMKGPSVLEEIAAIGGFTFKETLMSGDAEEDPDNPKKVLGLIWETKRDRLRIDVKVNFSNKQWGARTALDEDLEDDEEEFVPEVSTKGVLWRVV